MSQIYPFPDPADLAIAHAFIQVRVSAAVQSRTAVAAAGPVRAVMDKYGLKRLPCGDVVAVASDAPGWVELRPRARGTRRTRRSIWAVQRVFS